ncbi:HpcH/HpaI aldolase/citrate lyase family protein [Archangium gephyra]|uniref:HpcH/HpaI aldolase/citrate lyase family protein n=1 Tax=Archangium gephyra TaxID=48 RepID=UPI0035D45840
MSALELGASLYVPASRCDLLAIANGLRHPELRSVIFCTEDSIRADDLERALEQLATVLPRFGPRPHTRRFIRVRNADVLRRILPMPGIERIDGFVLPKVTRHNLPEYLTELEGTRFLVMPTLETAEAFDQVEMRHLQRLLMAETIRPRILALRIGGNDLLNLLGVRRSPRRTIYDTAVGPTIAMLAGTFRPHGLPLTAPVFEGLAHPEVLLEEVERDLAHGLFGKTAVHPDQVSLIESAYAVSPEELEMAERVLAEGAPAVFRMHDTMCEEATHARWAEMIRARAELYGLTGAARLSEARHKVGRSA